MADHLAKHGSRPGHAGLSRSLQPNAAPLPDQDVRDREAPRDQHGHQKIQEADYLAALEELGWTVMEDLNLELRDIVNSAGRPPL